MKPLFRFFAATLFLTTIHAESVTVFLGTAMPKHSLSRGIYAVTFDSDTGRFIDKPELAAEVRNPGFLAMHPQKPIIYAAAQEAKGRAGLVIAYKINGKSLEFMNAETLPEGRAAHLDVNPTGTLLITAQYGAGAVSAFPLQEDGTLAPRSQVIKHEGASNVVPKRQNAPHPHYAGFDHSGKYAFVPDLGMDAIVVYAVAENQQIKQQHTVAAPPGSGPRHLKQSVDGQFIYLLNELHLSLTRFALNSDDGSLELLETTPALSEGAKAKESFKSASEIRVHPNGKFIYTANRGHDSITVFEINPETGSPRVVEVEPIRGAFPRNFNLDPTGRWLIAAGADSSTLSVFEITPETGELTYHRGSILNVPNPICVLFSKHP